MSLEELREQNKSLVVEKALELFMKDGIEQTKVKDIARAAGLTERSIYRYFETKADIVQAAAYLYYRITTESIGQVVEASSLEKMSGIEQIRTLMYYYANMYFDNPDGIRFTLDAEIALYNAGKNKRIMNRPPERFELSDSPVVKAIRKGLEDGSVCKDIDVKELYYNAYDSVLGVMQKFAFNSTGSFDTDSVLRMQHLCDVFVSAFKGN